MPDHYSSWLERQRAVGPSAAFVDRTMQRVSREPDPATVAVQPYLARLLDWVSAHRLAQAACLVVGCALAALRLLGGLQFLLSY